MIEEPIWNTLSPRIHVAFDPFGDGKTVIKGGWGRFPMMRYTDMTQIANWNQFNQTTYVWHDLNNDKLYQPGEVNLDPNGADYLSTTQGDGAFALGVINPNEKTPGTNEFTASVERELMPNLALRVSGIYSRTYNQHRLANTKRPYDVYNIPIRSADPGPDGVPGNGRRSGHVRHLLRLSARVRRRQEPDADAHQRRQRQSEFQERRVRGEPAAGQPVAVLRVLLVHQEAHPVHRQRRHAGGLTYYLATYDPNAEINNADNTTEWLGTGVGVVPVPL